MRELGPVLVLTVRQPGLRSGPMYRFEQDRVLVGRGRRCALQLPDEAIPPRALCFERVGLRWVVRVLSSQAPVLMGGLPLEADRPVPLGQAAQLSLGGYTLDAYLDEREGPTTDSQERDRLITLLAQGGQRDDPDAWWVWIRGGGAEDGAAVARSAVLKVTGPTGEGRLRLADPQLDQAPLLFWRDEAGLYAQLGPQGGELRFADGQRAHCAGPGPHLIEREALLYVSSGVLSLRPSQAWAARQRRAHADRGASPADEAGGGAQRPRGGLEDGEAAEAGPRAGAHVTAQRSQGGGPQEAQGVPEEGRHGGGAPQARALSAREWGVVAGLVGLVLAGLGLWFWG